MGCFFKMILGIPTATLLLALLLGLVFAEVNAQEPDRQDDAQPAQTKEALWKAAREGNLEIVKSTIAAGVEVDSKTEYGATALFYACDRGHEEVVKFLLEKGADPNAKDTFYNATPMTWAKADNKKIVLLLLSHGGAGADSILLAAVSSGDADYAKDILATGVVKQPGLIKARDAAIRRDRSAKEESEETGKLTALFAGFDLPEPAKAIELTPKMLKQFEGKYKTEQFFVDVEATNESLKMSFNGGAKTDLVAVGENEFTIGASSVQFELENGVATELVFVSGENETRLPRDSGTDSEDEPLSAKTEEMKSEEMKSEAATKDSAVDADEPADSASAGKGEPGRGDFAISSSNWPGFRGTGARGIADGQDPPITWKVDNQDDSSNENILWKTPVAGLGLSCPTIWGDRLYITSAVTENDEEGLKIGLYGDVDSVKDDREYEFKLLCYSKLSGELIWEKTANKAKPAVMRHAKSSHANPTVATNGEQVVAFFGSEGLYCYSPGGDLLWKKDLGFLDSGWFYDPGYQWGFGSSPLIHKDRVIVQCDIQGQSFVAAFDLNTGEEVWRTDRDEIPTWSSPTVHAFDDTEMLITNGTKSARGYDVDDGKLLWSLKGHSEIVVPTPFVAHDLIFVASGYSPIRPIYAIKPTARGDISLEGDATTNASIPWSVKRGGPYMPSPIVYGDHLYCCSNSGILTCHVATTGEELYKERIKATGGALSFTASPIAADGHLYLTSEDGRVIVVKAGSEYELVGINECGESILATPAISEGVIYFRTQDSLLAVGKH